MDEEGTVERGGTESPRAEVEKSWKAGCKDECERSAEGGCRRGRPGEMPLARVGREAECLKGVGGGGLKYQRVNAHREAAQFNGMVSGRPATASGTVCAPLGPPDTTFFIPGQACL